MIDEFLKFRGRPAAVVEHEIGFATHIYRKKVARVPQFYRARCLQ